MTQPRDGKKRAHILVVDDEPRMVSFIRMNLDLDGYQISEAYDGIAALEAIRTKLPDCVLLDVMMPRQDGFETLRKLREFSNVPVIMLTAKSEESDVQFGLDFGADDYVTKPFSPRILSSRIRAVLRRLRLSERTPDEKVKKIDERLSFDSNRRLVTVDGKEIKLRPTEFRLLDYFIKNAGWTLSYDLILANVWGHEYQDEAHYVRLYVNYLRSKIEEDRENPRYILTERGEGYRFVDFRQGEG
ncbi:MAG: response regulator transcription factor [Anaerolineaceae bacterium]|nr:response regulator transcription factor [Anaerolineaceae bacterium]